MMQLGIFAKTFSRSTLAGVLDAVIAHGIDHVHFDLSCAGLPSMPDQIDPRICDRIRAEFGARGLTMVSVSGTYNMAHPDLRERELGLSRLAALAAVCRQLGTSVIDLCTGTRNPVNKWRYHPDNASPEAWRDLVASMQAALQIAADYDVTLGIEPEVSNVVDSASKARQLLDDMASPQLKVIIDGANLFPAGTLPRQHEILDAAFELLGEHIIMAHAKDLSRDGAAGHEAAGTGLLDYGHYIAGLRSIGFDGPLVLHSLDETQVEQSVRFLREQLAA
jgi:sugar phosphate isomerase/epimerase